MNNTSQLDRARSFVALHEREGAFLIPNPWDAGSARMLEALGFEALATTSSGFARTLGRSDGMVTLDEKLAHVRLLSGSVNIPLSADLEDGFARDPKGVAETITRVAEAGAVGASIEDHTRDPEDPIFDFQLSVERVHAAVEAARAFDFPFTLTARSENLLWDRMDLDDTIRRLQAFESVGADVLYAPGLTTLPDVRRVTNSVKRPVNVLGPLVKGATTAEIARAGAKRISLGGALQLASVSGALIAAMETLDRGSFEWLHNLETQASWHVQ